jgi:uncharacterized protein (UPF0218 family)
MHDQPLPQCETLQCEIKATVHNHLQESGAVRDMVKDHDRRISSIEKYIEKQGNLRVTIIGSSFSVIVVILLACIGWAVAWGQLLEKTNRLERLHPYGVPIGNVN